MLDARCVGEDIVQLRGIGIIGVPDEVENKLFIGDGAFGTWDWIAAIMSDFVFSRKEWRFGMCAYSTA